MYTGRRPRARLPLIRRGCPRRMDRLLRLFLLLLFQFPDALLHLTDFKAQAANLLRHRVGNVNVVKRRWLSSADARHTRGHADRR